MAVILGATSAVFVDPSTSMSWTHTPDALDTLVLVSLTSDLAVSDISVTYGGTAMTQRGGSGASPAAITWYLEITAGQGAKTVSISYTENRSARGSAASFSGQRAVADGGLGTAADATGNSSAPSVTVVSEGGGYVKDASGQNSGTYTSVGAGQTSIAHGYAGGSSTEVGATSVVMSWGTNTSNVWRSTGVGINPKIAGNQVSWFFSRMRDFSRDLRAGLIPPQELRRRYGDLVTI